MARDKLAHFRCFHTVKLEHTSHGMLFRGIVQTKQGERLRKTGGIRYSRPRELLLNKIAKLGFDPALFGMHSLRAGGAIASSPGRQFKFRKKDGLVAIATMLVRMRWPLPEKHVIVYLARKPFRKLTHIRSASLRFCL